MISANLVYIQLSLVYLTSQGYPDGYSVIILEETTYETYKQTCARPADFKQDEVYRTVTEVMRHAGVTSLWLPIKRVDLGEWRWLGGPSYRRQMSAPRWTRPGLDCAVLRSVDPMIDDVPCASIYSYHICETLDAETNVPIPRDSTDAPILKTFILKQANMNWYQAKENCHLAGYRLATLPGADLDNITVEVKRKLGNHENFWLGLRQKDYFYDLGSKDEIITQNWNSSSLCTCPEKECVILKVGNANQFLWNPENCNASHRYACMLPAMTTANVTVELTSMAPPPTSDMKKWIIIGASAGGGLLLLVVIITAVVCCWRRHKREFQVPLSAREISMETLDDINAADPLLISETRPTKPMFVTTENLGRILGSLAETIHQMKNITVRQAIFKALNVPTEDLMRGISQLALEKEIADILLDWADDKDPTEAWEQLQNKINDSKLVLLQPWLQQIRNSNLLTSEEIFAASNGSSHGRIFWGEVSFSVWLGNSHIEIGKGELSIRQDKDEHLPWLRITRVEDRSTCCTCSWSPAKEYTAIGNLSFEWETTYRPSHGDDVKHAKVKVSFVNREAARKFEQALWDTKVKQLRGENASFRDALKRRSRNLEDPTS